jgi:hypothetical protein
LDWQCGQGTVVILSSIDVFAGKLAQHRLHNKGTEYYQAGSQQIASHFRQSIQLPQLPSKLKNLFPHTPYLNPGTAGRLPVVPAA